MSLKALPPAHRRRPRRRRGRRGAPPLADRVGRDVQHRLLAGSQGPERQVRLPVPAALPRPHAPPRSGVVGAARAGRVRLPAGGALAGSRPDARGHRRGPFDDDVLRVALEGHDPGPDGGAVGRAARGLQHGLGGLRPVPVVALLPRHARREGGAVRRRALLLQRRHARAVRRDPRGLRGRPGAPRRGRLLLHAAEQHPHAEGRARALDGAAVLRLLRRLRPAALP